MTKSTEIIPKQETLPATQNAKESWGVAPVLSAKDIIIPRMMIMQGQSEKVLAGEAQFGDIRDSVSNELLGSVKQPLEVIPFSMKKAIIVSEWNEKAKAKDKYEYKEMIDSTPENEALPYEEAGLKRQRVVSFFVVLPSEITGGGAIPKIISIKGNSMQAAKIIATQMYAINADPNNWQPPCAYTMILTTKIDKNDKGTFAVLEARRGRKSTPEEIEFAFGWYKSLGANKAHVKVDEEHGNDEDEKIVASAKAAFAPKEKSTSVPPPPDFRDPPNF